MLCLQMPILEYAAVAAGPMELPCLASSTHYMQCFLPNSMDLGEMGYLVVVSSGNVLINITSTCVQLAQTIQSAIVGDAQRRSTQHVTRITCTTPRQRDRELLLDRLHQLHDQIALV